MCTNRYCELKKKNYNNAIKVTIITTLTTHTGSASTNIASSASSSSTSTSTLATKTNVKKVKLELMSYEFLEKELAPVIQHFRYVCVCECECVFVCACTNAFYVIDLHECVEFEWKYVCVRVS